MADYVAAARRAAINAGIDPDVFVRQIRQESGFDPNIRSGAGATGIAQIMPDTARGWGVNPLDPIASLNAAAKHMRSYIDQFGSYRNALIAYNAGPGRVGKPLYDETRKYIDIILGGKEPAAPTSRPKRGGSTPIASAASQNTQTPYQVTTQLQPITLPERSKRPAVTAPALPSFAQGAAGALQVLQGSTGAPGAKARFNLDDALKALTPKTATLSSTRGQQGATPSAAGSKGSTAAPSSVKMPKGTAKFEGKTVAAWIAPILAYAREHGWKGQVNSGFRTYAEQKRIWDSGVRPAAKPGQSNHEGSDWPRGAVDVSDPATLNRILSNSPYAKKLVWAGDKDPVHFSHPHNGSY